MMFLAACETGAPSGAGLSASDASADASQADASQVTGESYVCQTATCGAKSTTCGCEPAGTVQPADTACTTTKVQPCDDQDPCTTDSCGFNGCVHTDVCKGN